MLFRASARELLHHPLRTGLAVLGVAVSAAMLVDMLMLGGGITSSFRELLLGRGYAIRVTPRGTLPLDTDATLEGADSLRRAMASEPGVAGVAPALAVRLTAAGSSALALGVDPDEQGVYRLTGGREPGPGEAVVGPELARERHLAPGDSLVLVAPAALGTAASGRRTFRVAGTAEFVYASRGERSVAVPIRDLGSLSGRPDRASFLMVRTAGGRDAEAVARTLSRDFPRVAVASASDLVERAGRRLAYFRQLAVILGTVSLFVAALLVGTIMAVSIGERAGILAALRAVGVSRRSLVTALAAESLVVTAAAAVLGLGLGLVVAGRLESILADFAGLPRAVRFFVLRPGPLFVGYGALLAAGTAAAVVPAWRAASGSIALALHREEP